MNKNEPRRQTISCGTLTYKFADDWSATEILLVKQFANKDAWGLPKGHINSGETLEECAARETLEETGIAVEVGMRLHDVAVTLGKEDKTVVTFLATQTCSNQPIHTCPESEVADARWFKICELPTIVKYQKELISSGLDHVYAHRKLRGILDGFPDFPEA